MNRQPPLFPLFLPAGLEKYPRNGILLLGDTKINDSPRWPRQEADLSTHIRLRFLSSSFHPSPGSSNPSPPLSLDSPRNLSLANARTVFPLYLPTAYLPASIYTTPSVVRSTLGLGVGGYPGRRAFTSARLTTGRPPLPMASRSFLYNSTAAHVYVEKVRRMRNSRIKPLPFATAGRFLAIPLGNRSFLRGVEAKFLFILFSLQGVSPL